MYMYCHKKNRELLLLLLLLNSLRGAELITIHQWFTVICCSTMGLAFVLRLFFYHDFCDKSTTK